MRVASRSYPLTEPADVVGGSRVRDRARSRWLWALQWQVGKRPCRAATGFLRGNMTLPPFGVAGVPPIREQQKTPSTLKSNAKAHILRAEALSITQLALP